MEQIEFFSAVLIVSENPARLAEFYRDVVGVALKDEAHGTSLPHYGCNLGDTHFAIHPVETFPDKRHGVGAIKMAFSVFDIKALVERLESKGVELLYRPFDTGFFITTAINDPMGTTSSSLRCATTGSSRSRRDAGRGRMSSHAGKRAELL